MTMYLFNLIADYLIRLALRTPYYHLHHVDGSFYMERYWLVPFTNLQEPGCWIASFWREPSVWLLQKLGIAIRVHRIHTPDLDRAMHDHPWAWVSVVLRGGYTEALPIELNPCFAGEPNNSADGGFAPDEELNYKRPRGVGSLVARHPTNRHRIVSVLPGTMTLFITGPKVQWWGFYTPLGKVHYRDYESAHNKSAIQ